MNKWESIKAHESLLKEADRLQDCKVYLSTFGGFSKKGLWLSGSWAGIKLIIKLHELMLPHVKKRPLLKLTKEQTGGKWRPMERVGCPT